MNLKLVTLFFAGWILFLTVLFLLGILAGRLDKEQAEKNPHHLSERALSQYQETPHVESRMGSPMESRMESQIQTQWQSVSRRWSQFSKLIGSMRGMMHQPISISQREMSFEKEISQEDTQSLKQKITVLPAQWEALGTSIPAMEE
jgi:hypothetical protein